MKKYLTLILLFSFLLSTAGLPISIHYCEMNDKSSASACEVCSPEKTRIMNSCCSNEMNFPVQLKSTNTKQCCKTQIVDKSISDNYILVKEDLKKEQRLTITPIADEISKYFELNQIIVQRDLSPPIFFYNHLYLQNSILLI